MRRQLLANLYARGAAIQGSLNQDSLDLLIPTCTGAATTDAVFDLATLSAIVVQVKFKSADDDEQAGDSLRSTWILREHSRPLPYLRLLMELGNESVYKDTGCKIQTMIPPYKTDTDFRMLVDVWLTAEDDLDEYEYGRKVKGMKVEKEEVEKKKAAAREARLAMDF
jgi:hypothetical protein